MRRLRTIIEFASIALPWPLRRLLLVHLFGHDIDPTARIGLSHVSARKIILEPGARIGHLTFISGLDLLHVAEQAKIGNLNWVSGLSSDSRKHFNAEEDRRSELLVGRHASITARHYIDCCNSVRIGAFTTIAGGRSQILTHAIDLRLSLQRSAPVVIGDYCFVGTGAIVLRGAVLPDFSVLAAGSCLSGKFTETYKIYSGVPAVAVRDLDESYAYFSRPIGRVA